MDKRPASEPASGNPAKRPKPDHGASTSAMIAFLCHLCTATFSTVWNLTRHLKSLHGSETFDCDICQKSFSQKYDLTHHRKSHEMKKPTTIHECLECNKTSRQKIDLTRHQVTHMPHACDECFQIFLTRAALIKHRKVHLTVPLAKANDPAPNTDPRNPTSATCPPKGCKTSLKGSYERHRMEGTEDDVDLATFLKSQPHADQIRDAIKRRKSIKFFISVNVKMIRPKNWLTRGDQESTPYFTSRCYRVLEATDIDELLAMAYEKIVDNMSQYQKEGSGWIVGHVKFVDLVISTYKPMKGSSYVPLPKPIYLTKSVVNVKNEDQECFKWAILSALHPHRNSDRVGSYKPYENDLKFEGLTFPVTPDDISNFENQNNLRVNLFGYCEKDIFPIYVSKRTSNPINLLLISANQTQHYCWIKNFNRLMRFTTDNQAFFCFYCLHRFSKQRLLDRHMESCRQHGPQKVRFPEEEEKFMAFSHPGHSLLDPYTIYAGFESMIVPISQSVGSKTMQTADHLSSTDISLGKLLARSVTMVFCRACNKPYSTVQSLARHVEEVHNNPSIVCISCGKKFRRSDALKIHTAAGKCVQPYKGRAYQY